MPEGPELNLSAKYVNTVCKNKTFAGNVVKSEVTKNPVINWNEPFYSISAESRGKELRLTLTALKDPVTSSSKQSKSRDKIVPLKLEKEIKIVFSFGMSGRFNFCATQEVVKHSHLKFFSSGSPEMVLSFVDYRRFGKWRIDDNWNPDRSPCVILEYQHFRQNVLDRLEDSAFNRPICEALLNQKYFNGMGNYLRAEVLFRAGIQPFDKARDVLEELVKSTENGIKVKLKKENSDILQLCNELCLEVVNLGATIYNPSPDEDYSKFTAWLQCYYQPGMKNMVDHNKRTIWYSGEAGPMVPKEIKTKGRLNTYAKKMKTEVTGEEEGESPKKKRKSVPKLAKTKDTLLIKDKIKTENKVKSRVTRTSLKAEKFDIPDENNTTIKPRKVHRKKKSTKLIKEGKPEMNTDVKVKLKSAKRKKATCTKKSKQTILVKVKVELQD